MQTGFQKNKQTPLSENSPIYKLVKFFERYEMYALAIFLLSVLLFSTGMTGMSMLVMAVMNTLAVIYFFSAFMPLPEAVAAEKVIFLFKVAGIGSAIAVVGLLFSMLGWPGRPMLIGGMLTTGFSLVFSFFTALPDEALTKRLNIIRIRTFILALICAAYVFTPKEILIENGFQKVNQHEQSNSLEPGSNPTPHP